MSRATTQASRAHQLPAAPKRCDLSAGILTDDTAGTVTFRLTRADPDFLYKLALFLVAPAPPGAPDHAISRAPFLPGTGPHMISQVKPGKSMTLVRNPYFRQWSYAAQPAGYPSVIRYQRMADQRTAESAVIDGRADLTLLTGNNQSLAIRYPARVHPGLKVNTSFVSLNTRQPPFSNAKARQAISYAIDRARIIQLFRYARARPPRRARCSRPTSPATGRIAPTRPPPRTGPGTART